MQTTSSPNWVKCQRPLALSDPSALDQLPPRAREAVLLRKIEGLSYREIALRMGIGEDTVSEHLSKAMYALADTLYGEPLGGKP